MKKNIITILILLLINMISYAQDNNEMLDKIITKAGDKTYLKDFPINLKPGEDINYSISLNKRTLYAWYINIPDQKKFEIRILDSHENIMFSNKSNNIGITSFTSKCNNSDIYHIYARNNSSKSLSSMVVLTYAGKFNPKKEENNLNSILEKVNNESKGTYLKDFKVELKPGETERYSVVLSKGTKYGFYFYQEEGNQLQFLITDKDLNSADDGDIFAQPGVNESEFNCPKTAVYHLKLENLSNKKLETILLLTFINRTTENTVGTSTKTKKTTKSDNTEKNESYYFVVDKMPKFKGKDDYKEFKAYLNQHIKYPQEAIDKKIEGKVYVQFVVGKDGYLKDAKITRGVHPSVNQEALRVVYSSPKWEPGIKDGKPVDVILTLPVEFKLP